MSSTLVVPDGSIDGTVAKTKRCPCCKHAFPLSGFYKDLRRRDGAYPYCIPCEKKKQAVKRLDPRARARAMFATAKCRSKKYGLAFSLSVDWITRRLETGCEVTGLPFDFGRSKASRFNPSGPSLDRRDSSKGYTEDNVQVVLFAYNMVKNDGDDGVIRALLIKMGEALRDRTA